MVDKLDASDVEVILPEQLPGESAKKALQTRAMWERDNVSVEPDPFWPEGMIPPHLSPAERRDDVLQQTWKEKAGVDLAWRCEECGTQVDRSAREPRLCNRCYIKAKEARALATRTNEGWQELAQSLGLAIYERQPEETDLEWRIWEKYRSYYPLALPTWGKLAEAVGCSVSAVTRAANRWNYRARMVAWAQFADGENQEKRIAAIKEMNAKQLDMSQRLLQKVSDGIDQIDPALLRPSELVNLMKLSVELERKITTYVEEKVESTAVQTQSKEKPKTKAEDLSEVLGILAQTGVLPAADKKKVVGVEQKTTILVREDGDGNGL